MLAAREPCKLAATHNNSKPEVATIPPPAQYLAKHFMIGHVPPTLLLQLDFSAVSFHLLAHGIGDSSSLCAAYALITTPTRYEASTDGTIANNAFNLLNSKRTACSHLDNPKNWIRRSQYWV